MASYASVEELREILDEIGTTGSESNAVLQKFLDRATAIVRKALAYLIGDPAFDYGAYPAASTTIIRSYGETEYLLIPVHQANNVTLVEELIGTNPATYQAISDEWLQEADGSLWRASGWIDTRYRITAPWGYGPVTDEIKQLTLEVTINIWRSKDKGSFTEMIGAEGGGSTRFIGGFTKQQQSILESVAYPLRRPAL